MQRKIIEIDESLCNGCGQCVTDCAEGALQIVNGVAKLVKDDFCDGLGACLGACPTGALQIIEREAPAFDDDAVKHHVKNQSGHQHATKPMACGCPGSMQRAINQDKQQAPVTASTDMPASVLPSELTQWPVQLHLVSPTASYLEGRELVVMSTCGPVASPDVHWRFIRGRSVVVACPKLDRTEPYQDKLTAILTANNIPRVIAVTMDVPCCRRLNEIVSAAVAAVPAGKRPIFEECVIGLDGRLQQSRIHQL